MTPIIVSTSAALKGDSFSPPPKRHYADIPGLFHGNAGQEKSHLCAKMNLDGDTASVLVSMGLSVTQEHSDLVTKDLHHCKKGSDTFYS